MITGDEKSAYQRMVEGLSHAQEAAVELAHYQCDGSFILVANMLQETKSNIIKLAAQKAQERMIKRLMDS